MLRLLKLLGDRYTYEFVINDDDRVTRKKIKGKYHVMLNPRVFKESTIKKAYKTIKGFLMSFKIWKKSEAEAIISAGPGLTVPLFLAAKLLGKKTIYIESWSRAHSKSMSGKLCYPMSDMFFVQWPDMKKEYPKAVYAGRLG
jgi:UDP-N-acetylglucosamine:LPS N-acetylglucosamine transferase